MQRSIHWFCGIIQRMMPSGSKAVYSGGQFRLVLDLIALTPHIVEQHIKDCHRNRGDPLAQTQGNGVVFKPRGTQCQRTGDKVKGVTCAQHHGHQAKELELRIALASTDHQNADGDHRDQIYGVKKCFNHCLH